jgi:hypothetical protein
MMGGGHILAFTPLLLHGPARPYVVIPILHSRLIFTSIRYHANPSALVSMDILSARTVSGTFFHHHHPNSILSFCHIALSLNIMPLFLSVLDLGSLVSWGKKKIEKIEKN